MVSPLILIINSNFSAYFGPMEVPAPVTGRIVAITAKQGDNVEKGEILGFIE